MQNDPSSVQAHLGGDRSRALRRIAIYTPTAALLILLQTTLLHRFPLFGHVPDLCYLFILGVAMLDGAQNGGILGLAAGFLCAAWGETGISMLPLLFFITGYAVGHLSGRALARTFPSYMIFSLALCLIRPLFTLAAIGLTAQPSSFDLSQIMRFTLLPEFFANLLTSVPMYPITKRVVVAAQKTK